MKRSLILAMVAAIALTAGLAFVLDDDHEPAAPVYAGTPMSLRMLEVEAAELTADVSNNEASSGDALSDVMFYELLPDDGSTTTSSTTSSTTSTTSAPKAPPNTAPRPTTTTTRPNTTTTTKPSGSYQAEFEAQFLAKINDYRAEHGLAPLQRVAALNDRARDWSRQMANAGSLSHSSLGSLLPPWSAAGENVGYGGSVNGLFQAFINSEGHNNVLLNLDRNGNRTPTWTHVGIGVWRAENGRIWTTHVFVR